jgi:hypothetical protein
MDFIHCLKLQNNKTFQKLDSAFVFRQKRGKSGQKAYKLGPLIWLPSDMDESIIHLPIHCFVL